MLCVGFFIAGLIGSAAPVLQVQQFNLSSKLHELHFT